MAKHTINPIKLILWATSLVFTIGTVVSYFDYLQVKRGSSFELSEFITLSIVVVFSILTYINFFKRS